MNASSSYAAWSRWMLHCIDLAKHAEGQTAPNPMVGAVLLDEQGDLLAQGWHKGPGQAHAELIALAKVNGQASGATMVVNLEPCCHIGRTPPCTNAILASGLRRVVVGMIDPNPLVAGKGIQILQQAGIEVLLGVEEEACRALNHAFVTLMDSTTS